MDEIRNLSVNDVSICSEYMSVFIPKRKNDQYGEGHTSLLARSHKATCPVSITERLLKTRSKIKWVFPKFEISVKNLRYFLRLSKFLLKFTVLNDRDICFGEIASS